MAMPPGMPSSTPARAGARNAIVSPVVTCPGVAPRARAIATGYRVSSAVVQAMKTALTVARMTSMTDLRTEGASSRGGVQYQHGDKPAGGNGDAEETEHKSPWPAAGQPRAQQK